MLRLNRQIFLSCIVLPLFLWSASAIAHAASPQKGKTQKKPETAQQGQPPASTEGGVFVFKKQVDEVLLHATVLDGKKGLVTNLTKNDFKVYEDGKQQTITSFRHEDIPVAVGIVIDNSGSMRDKRPAVNQAAINFVRASNPQDEVFIVNFNQQPYLDQDFTSNIDLLRDALDRIESRGGTALYDAIVASADQLKKEPKLEKKVLLVVTDGEDNASKESLETAVRRVAVDGGPVIYTIGLLGGEKEKKARRALRMLAQETGGIAYFPKDLTQVDSITREVARDIRSQYAIGYKPTTPQSQGGYRTVKVEAKAPGYRHLIVRTRTGYYASAPQHGSQ